MFSPDGNMIITEKEGNEYPKPLKLIDAKTGQLLHILEGHRKHILSYAFSFDGQKIASTSADETIRIWNARTGKHQARLTGFKERALSCAFLADNRTLLTVGGGSTLRIWDTEKAVQTNQIAGSFNKIISLPALSRVVCGDVFGAAYIFEVSGL